MCENKETNQTFPEEPMEENSRGRETMSLAFQKLLAFVDSSDIARRAFWISSTALVLRSLCLKGRSSAADLSDLGISKGTLYRALARLRDLGLIEEDGYATRKEKCEGRRPAVIWRLRST